VIAYHGSVEDVGPFMSILGLSTRWGDIDVDTYTDPSLSWMSWGGGACSFISILGPFMSRDDIGPNLFIFYLPSYFWISLLIRFQNFLWFKLHYPSRFYLLFKQLYVVFLKEIIILLFTFRILSNHTFFFISRLRVIILYDVSRYGTQFHYAWIFQHICKIFYYHIFIGAEKLKDFI